MDNLCRALKIPVPFLKAEFNRKKYSLARQRQFDRDDISQEYLEWISSLGLTLVYAEIFFSLPNKHYEIHKDQHNLNDFPKINWIFGDSVSYMNWYEPKLECQASVSNTRIGSPYVGYQPTDVDKIYSCELTSPSLVQAGVPHNVTVLNAYRWCVSTVYHCNSKLITFDKAVETLSPFMA